MNVNTLLRQMERRRFQIALELSRLEGEEKRLLEEKEVIERDVFINRQID